VAAIDREAVYVALFDRLKSALAGDVVFFTRRHLATMECQVQPALVMVASTQGAEQALGTPPVWTLGAEVLLYVQTANVESPDTLLHAIVRKVEDALAYQHPEPVGPGELRSTTLGGLCQYAWINGDIEFEPGIGTGQAVVGIPVGMVVAETVEMGP